MGLLRDRFHFGKIFCSRKSIMANIVGSSTDDTLIGTSEADNIWGLAGDDNLNGIGGDDFIYGGAGNDILTSSSGFDRLDGGDGDDKFALIGVGGAVAGGDGFDTLSINLRTTSQAVIFNGEKGHGIVGDGSTHESQIFFRDIERLELITGNGNDRILGATTDDSISTGGGNDLIGPYFSGDSGTSMLGDDYVDAGPGYDTITDTLGNNRLFGGDGDDAITTTLSSAEIDGGNGNDRLYLSDAARTEGTTIDFVQGTSSTGSLIRGFESVNIELGAGNDRIIATNLSSTIIRAGEGDNYIEGSNGVDYIVTGSGDDVMIGGDRDDILISVGGTDLLIGGDGNDILHDASLNAEDGFTTINGGTGDDTILVYYPEGSVDGGGGIDTLNLSSYPPAEPVHFDATAGTMGTGFTFANVENFLVAGGASDDILRGAGGIDFLAGNDGNDIIAGGAGNDELWGGSGADQMTGGDGADMFRFWSDTYFGTGIDHITDFDTQSGDVLRIIGPATTVTGIHNFNDFLAASTQTADGVYVAFHGSNTYGILLENVQLSSFSADDLVFS